MTTRLEPAISARPSAASRLLGWRTHFGFGWLEALLLALYVLVLAFTIPHHEPWADEAQAWVIARDNSIWQILRYRLHYEGAPGLWHVLLHGYQLLGGRYGGIDWFAATFATAGIIVFLCWSPFPLLIRILLPFTFFLVYQYAVIARGYVLFPLLAFCMCSLFYSRRNPLWFALAAGLLANISLQGTVYSFFLIGLYLFQRFRHPVATAEAASASHRGRQLWRPVALYLALFAVAAFAAVPAPDCGFATGGAVTEGPLHDLLMHYPGPLPPDQKLPVPPPYAQKALLRPPPPPLPPLPPEPPRAEPPLLHGPGAWAAWYLQHDTLDAQGHILPRPFTKSLLTVTLEVLALATGPLSTFKLLACTFLVVLFLWLWKLRSLRMLLPWASNVIVGEALWIADHHTGMLFLSLLTAIWLAIQAPAATAVAGRRKPSQLLDRTLVLLLTAICLLQIVWSFVAIRNDTYKSYDPGSETAAVLLQHPHARMASFDFVAVGVQPYFKQNPFYNLRHSYWVWAINDNPNGAHLTTLEQHPDLVLFSQDLLAPGFMHNDWAPLSPDTTATQNRDLARNPIILDLQAHGYRETHRFCGDRFMRLSASYRACHLIFEPAPKP